ncbi:META domain-containing protein [Flavobacterium pedocola]
MRKHILLSLFTVIIIGCKPARQTQDTATATPTDHIYFKATGNEPFWGLSISEAEIQLKSLADDKTYTFPHKAPIKAMDANVKTYRTENAEGKLEIVIQQAECINDMSGDKSPYTVTLTFEKKNAATTRYKGCGSYQLPIRFHDIWALEELNGRKVTLNDFTRQMPFFEIDSKTNTYSGYGGCNGMSGKLFYEPGVLRFERGISTLMYCGDYNKENELFETLSKVTRYEFKDLRLVLSNPNGVLVVMKKVD